MSDACAAGAGSGMLWPMLVVVVVVLMAVVFCAAAVLFGARALRKGGAS